MDNDPPANVAPNSPAVFIGNNRGIVNTNFIKPQPKDRPKPNEGNSPPADFTGRKDLTGLIKHALLESTLKPVVISGMGGIGKTSLVEYVVHDIDIESKFYDGRFWIDCSRQSLDGALEHIADHYNFDISSEKSTDGRAKAIQSIIHDLHLLIILDNVWKLEEVKPFLPSSENVRLLFMTRDCNLANTFNRNYISVETLTEDESIEFLKKLIVQEEDDAFDCYIELADLLHGLPLAIELAGKRIAEEARNDWFDWKDQIELYRDSFSRLENLSYSDISVRASFELTFTRALDEKEQHLFALLGSLQAGDHSFSAILSVVQLDVKGTRNSIQNLMRYSLVKQISKDEYQLHPLVLDLAIEYFDRQEETEQKQIYKKAFEYFFDKAKSEFKEPKRVEDIHDILRSYHYAIRAKDNELVNKVYPWFTPENSFSTYGFLLRQGAYNTIHSMLLELASIATTGSGTAYADWELGESFMRFGDNKNALIHLNKALDYYRSVNYDIMVTKLETFIAQINQSEGNFDSAIAGFKKDIEWCVESGNYGNAALGMVRIGDCYRDKNDITEALNQYESAINFAQEKFCIREKIIALLRIADIKKYSTVADAYNCINQVSQLIDLNLVYNDETGKEIFSQPAVSDSEKIRLLTKAAFISEQLPSYLFPDKNIIARYFSLTIQVQNIDAPVQEAIIDYYFGTFLAKKFAREKIELIGKAAISFLYLSSIIIKEMESPPEINPGEILNQNVKPMIGNELFDEIIAEIKSNDCRKLNYDIGNKLLNL